MLDLSWQQIAICTSCIVQAKSEQLNIVMEIVSTAFGGKKSKKSKKRKNRSSKRDGTKNKAEKEREIFDKLQRMGIPFDTQGGDSA